VCCRFLNKGDANSTSNLWKHVKNCWGKEALHAAESAKDIKEARENVVNSLNCSGLITASFAQTGKGNVTYSNRQHTKVEARTELVCWVAESLRPFWIVDVHGFQCLMKTGQLQYYLPSPMTVSRNVKTVFAKTRGRIAKMLQVCCVQSWSMQLVLKTAYALQQFKGKLSFAMDCWTVPNHRAFMAVTVHLEVCGVPLCMLLDIVEVAKAHMGVALAEEFVRILEEFGMANKVSRSFITVVRRLTGWLLKLLGIGADNVTTNDVMVNKLAETVPDFTGEANRVRCFAHVLNLIAKTVIKQFDIPRKDSCECNEDDDVLAVLTEGIDREEIETRLMSRDEDLDTDNDEG
jgi:hypothetical protein